MWNRKTLKHLTVSNQISSDSFKNCYLQLFVNKWYVFKIDMYKQDLALNNIQGPIYHNHNQLSCPVVWGNRIHRLHLCRGVKKRVSWYDTKQSDWGMRSTPSLPSLPGPLWPGMVAPDRVLSMGQIKLNCVFMLNWIAWNRYVFDKLCTYAKTELFETELFICIKDGFGIK